MALFQQGMFTYDPRDTPDMVARKRRLAAQIMGENGVAPQSTLDGVGNAFASIMGGFAARKLNQQADVSEQAGQESVAAAWDPFVSALGPQQFPDAPGASVGGSSVDPASQRVAQAFGDSALPSSFLAAVDQYEGAGGYDTLFGHAQRGQFAGTDVSKMTVGQAMAFADPSGPYAQSVKAKIGRVATPMGRHQIVGKTLRSAAQEMGLDPSTPFNQQTQDAIAAHLARNRIASANTMDGKISALRSEWSGLKSVPYSRMAQIVTDLESGGTGSLKAAPVQVASLDPSAGVAEATASTNGPVPAEYAATGMTPETWARMNAPEGAMPSPGPSNVPITSGKSDRVTMAQAAPVQMQPGPIPNPGPEQSAFLGRMTNPQPMGGAPMPMQGMPSSAPQPALHPQQVAQAQPANPDLASVPVTAGGNAGQYQPGQGPSLQMLMQAAANPWLNDSQKAVINMMIKQQMDQQDPATALDRRYREAQIKNIESEIAKRDDPNARDKFGNSVIWGQDKDGKWVAMQPSSGGGLVPAVTPDGITLSPPGIANLDLGNQFGIRDRAGNVIGTVDKNLAAAEADKASGKAEGEAAFDLPRVEQNAEQTLGILKRMKTHPGREGSTGFIQGMLPSRTSDQVDFQSLVDQTQGQSFLQAFQMLKGGGQITEIEGQKATDAISRLRNQRLSDQDYLRAITDLEDVIRNGLARARRQAGATSAAPAASGGDWSDAGNGVKIRVKP